MLLLLLLLLLIFLQVWSSMDEICNGPETPYVASIGDFFHKDTTFYIVVENQIFLRSPTFISAVVMLIPVYYVLWIQYPQKAKSTLNFIEIELFNQKESSVLSSKVIKLIGELKQSCF